MLSKGYKFLDNNIVKYDTTKIYLKNNKKKNIIIEEYIKDSIPKIIIDNYEYSKNISNKIIKTLLLTLMLSIINIILIVALIKNSLANIKKSNIIIRYKIIGFSEEEITKYFINKYLKYMIIGLILGIIISCLVTIKYL